MPLQRIERAGAVGDQVGVTRLDRERAVKACERLLRPAESAENHAAHQQRVDRTCGNRQRPVAAHQGILLPPKRVKSPGLADKGFRRAAVERQSFVESFDGRLVPRLTDQRFAAAAICVGKVGLERERAIEARHRVIEPADGHERKPAIEPIRDRSRIDGQCFVVARDGLVGAAHIAERIGAAAVRLGEVGCKPDGGVETCQRIGGPPERARCPSQQKMRARLPRIGRQRSANQVRALGKAAAMARDQGKIIKRIGVGRFGL